MLAWIAAHDVALMGVMVMLVVGSAVGNYACTIVYRLPHGKTMSERHPYCGHCGADLKPIDLFPILSWLMTRGKCRYCGGEIPGVYTVIELVCGIAFIAYFLAFGMGELFLLYAALVTLVVILAAIEWQQGWIAATIYSYAMFVILLVRTLQEHSIYPTIQSTIVMVVLALAVWRVVSRNIPAFERPWVWWWVLLGALTPLLQWKLLVPLLLLQFLLPREKRVILYAVAALLLPILL